MSRLRTVLDATVTGNELIEMIFRKTGFTVSSLSEFYNRFYQELFQISKDYPGVPGAIVLTDMGGIAIALSDGNVYGVQESHSLYTNAEIMSWSEFAPRKVFYPHLLA
jgi:hypothetical protein